MRGRRRKNRDPVMEEVFTVVDIEDCETVCRVCEAEFLDEADLKVHVAQVHINESNGKTICKLCCTVLLSADEFVTHFIFKHLENSVFCFYCYRVFSDLLLYDQHELKHCAIGDESAVTCSQCCTIFTNRQELQNHEYNEHANSVDGLMLNGFFSLISSALNIKMKEFLDSMSRKKPLSCHKCKYTSSSIKDFLEHLKTFKCRCYACDNCFSVFKKKHSIMNHMLKKLQCHNFINKNDIKKLCKKCNKYIDSKDLRTHKKSCKIIQCSTCQKLFTSVYELTNHRNEYHKVKITLETCKLCKKQFVGALSLKKHMNRSHKDRNLYKYLCVHCGSVFNHPSKLFAHFFTRHKDIEPYTCKICNKCFKLRKHFTIHIKLQHKSIGFVEFDENFHVIFTDKKSENPIVPQANINMDSATDVSDSDCNDLTRAKRPRKKYIKQAQHKDNVSTKPQNNLDDIESRNKNPDPNENALNINNNLTSTTNLVQIEIKPMDTSNEEIRESVTKSPGKVGNSSDEEPLSHVRQTLLRQKNRTRNLKRRMAIRDKRAKLTCKTCHKYCYTVQNFHHHMTLHEKTKLKRCIKCNEFFKSRGELKDHIASSHSSSKLIETLRTVLEKRKKFHPVKTSESFKSVLEKRKRQHLVMVQNIAGNKFRRTIRKVDVADECTATITPMSDHGLSVKNFIENFKPEGDGVNISNSVTLKAINEPVNKKPLIKMQAFNPENYESPTTSKLRFPVKFKDASATYDTKISVKLVQQLITKPNAVNMTYNEKIPAVQENTESEDYCNMFADETDYTQFKNDSIPDVAQEVMLEDLEDIPRTRRLAQEIVIPKIPKEHGGVRIGHLLPQAPFFKIVKVKKLINASSEQEIDPIPEKDVKLPDGTRLISVKNPYSHLIPNEHLEEILKANRAKYYTPKTKNIEKAIAKALNQTKPPSRRGKRVMKKD